MCDERVDHRVADHVDARRVDTVSRHVDGVGRADPVERNRFRSTAFHSTVQLDGAEQNPISTRALFAMEGRRRAEALHWAAGPERAVFRGRHHG